MTRFTGSIASLETAIKDLSTYVGSVTTPRPLHTLETEILALAIRVAFASLAQCVSQGGTGHAGPVHTDAEGGERHLIGDRMDRTGMRWTEPGAQAMLDLRSIHVNGQVADFHAYRMEKEQEALYGANRPFQVDLCA